MKQLALILIAVEIAMMAQENEAERGFLWGLRMFQVIQGAVIRKWRYINE